MLRFLLPTATLGQALPRSIAYLAGSRINPSPSFRRGGLPTAVIPTTGRTEPSNCYPACRHFPGSSSTGTGTGKGGVLGGPSSGRRENETTRTTTITTQASCRWLSGLLAMVVVLLCSSPAAGVGVPQEAAKSPTAPPVVPEDDTTLADVPQTLSGGGGEVRKRIQRPKSRQAETCTVKCLGTCIRGGAGSPGEGPLNVRRPLVVFKPGFRSRNYCLVECSDICNLIKDGDDGP